MNHEININKNELEIIKKELEEFKNKYEIIKREYDLMKNDLEKYKCENKERKKSDESFLTFKEKIKLDENNKENNEIEKEKLKEEIEKNEKLQKIIDEQIEQINIYKSKETKARSKFAENHNKNMQDSQNSKKDIPKFLYINS